MSDKTPIEWTDATWNPVRGCTRVSPGCGGPKHQGGCYAEKIAARFSDPGQPFHGFAERDANGGHWTGRLALIEDKLAEPLAWKKPRRIFVNSMSDLFHENLPDEAIDRVFAVMALCPQHTFQVLTKRSARMREYMTDPGVARRIYELVADRVVEEQLPVVLMTTGIPDPGVSKHFPRIWLGTWPLPNVWLGVSAEDQARADERIPDLLATPAAVRFVSAEPLLGPIDFTRLRPTAEASSRYGGFPNLDALRGAWFIDGWRPDDAAEQAYPTLDWIIVGGESGPRARPMHPAWPRQIRDQCRAAARGGERSEQGTGKPAFFFKQWGEHLGGEGHDHGDGVWFAAASGEAQSRWLRTADTFDWFESDQEGPDGPMWLRMPKKTAGRLLDGREHNDFPEA